MRHEKEWYTCDRCESEIEMMPQRRTFFTRKLITSAEYSMKFANVAGYVADTELVSTSRTELKLKKYTMLDTKNFIYALNAGKSLRIG